MKTTINTVFNNLIFDFDGTIIDSSEDILISLKKSYEKCALKFPNVDSNIIGKPIEGIIKDLSPELAQEEIFNIKNWFRDIYDNCGFENTKLYEGIKEFLEFLKDEELFLVTNKPKSPTYKILFKLKILNNFKDIICVNSSPYLHNKSEMIREIIKAWDLEKDKTILIGDTFIDHAAAKENNVSFLSCLYGYEQNKKDLEEKSDFIVWDSLDFIKDQICV